MKLDGTYTATVDRIVEGQAVLLVEEGNETVDERYCTESDLPEGAGEGAVCELIFEDDDLVGVRFLPETTEERQKRMREKFDRLSKRLDEE